MRLEALSEWLDCFLCFLCFLESVCLFLCKFFSANICMCATVCLLTCLLTCFPGWLGVSRGETRSEGLRPMEEIPKEDECCDVVNGDLLLTNLCLLCCGVSKFCGELRCCE